MTGIDWGKGRNGGRERAVRVKYSFGMSPGVLDDPNYCKVEK